MLQTFNFTRLMVLIGLLMTGGWLQAATEPPQRSPEMEAAITAYEEQDYDTALKAFRKLAAADVTEAQYFLGTAYWYGAGVERDIDVSQSWYKKAFDTWLGQAQAGDAESMVEISMMYSAGLGVPRGDMEALEWANKAAELGSPRAFGVLGDLYLQGYGVEMDEEKARSWYQRAAAGGDPWGQEMVRRLASAGSAQQSH
ncbi:MAG: sel1 repeat family protein [Pseudomonadales bacterium]|nr:sel1 repeat family protein [Pseudomonadales bacterium]